jgi:hypothetical protein
MTPDNELSLRITKSANLSHRWRSCRVVSRESPIIIDITGPEMIRTGDGGWTAQ